ncbi:MAG: DUF6387 family protein [Methylotenera sp.]|nr:DUF6387 family protein [Methylotenera sp.]MDP1958908.1 DUF6387 family protein [Methylotenera sp.]MDP3942897.1 DUF6387 family protein [Methylotenera sp.]
MARNANEVRNVSDLPKWFDIKKYDASNELDYVGWYRNLFTRSRLLKLFSSPKFKNNLKTGIQNALDFYSDLESLRNIPLIGKRRFFFISNLEELQPQLGVRPMTLADLYWAKKSIAKDKQSYVEKIITNSEDSEEFWDAYYRTEKNKNWKVNPLADELSASLIHVNFYLPENLLLDQFKEMIKTIKSEKKRKPDFDKWIRYGVLPYIDLKIWELEHDKSITNNLMADAIYPNGEGDEEVVRKTIQKLADEILSKEYLDTLAALASNEISEVNRG